MKVQRHFTGSPWEPKVGYCRAVRAGDLVFVSGTAPVAKGGGVEAPGDPYRQARRCFEIAVEALRALGAGPEHAVRTRMYVSDASRWEEFGRAHAEAFGAHPPAATMIAVKGFVDPAMMIEVEVDAVAPAAPRPRRRPARPVGARRRRSR
jgi:enamine deaminase RidA (YjgF/YER057c/UK114 family)